MPSYFKILQIEHNYTTGTTVYYCILYITECINYHKVHILCVVFHTDESSLNLPVCLPFFNSLFLYLTLFDCFSSS